MCNAVDFRNEQVLGINDKLKKIFLKYFISAEKEVSDRDKKLEEIDIISEHRREKLLFDARVANNRLSK